MQVPFHRPEFDDATIDEVVRCLKSGWLTTGPITRRFETAFAEAVGARFAVALNSCTAALHLAVEALGLARGEAVLVPTMTFAATAEILHYLGAIPVLVDCDPETCHLDLDDAEAKLAQLLEGTYSPAVPRGTKAVGILPVHYAGLMLDMDAVALFARHHGLWVVEDAAHAFPAAWRSTASSQWQNCGEGTSSVTCFSFYANKTITTGEGGMAVTNDEALAARMRSMSLHGLSHDAWKRYSGGSWDYQIVSPGYKYNLTDLASAVGVHQLAKAEAMRQARERIAGIYCERLVGCEQIELPPVVENRIHSQHLFCIRLKLEDLLVDRNTFLQALKDAGVGCSVHWRPLHMHPYYRETFGELEQQLPQATAEWQRRISLPIFPGMRDEEIVHVTSAVRALCSRWSVKRSEAALVEQHA